MSGASTQSSCKQPPGSFVPQIDRNRCEGKGPCVPVCPYNVLAISRISREQRQTLSIIGWLKAVAHKGLQAQVIAPDACRACGLCVRACPERAITLARSAIRTQ